MPETQNKTDDKPEKAVVPSFPRERLVAEAEGYFGEPSHIVVAALSLADGRKQNFTVNEVEKKIAEYREGSVDLSATSEE